MKAISYAMPGVKLIDIPEPQIVNADDVKVRISYASICGSDIHTVKGEADDHFASMPKPIIMGHEASGIVTEVGKGATAKGLKPGDKVTYYYNTYCGKCYFCRNGQEQFCTNVVCRDTAMTEYMVLSEQQVFKLPDDVDLKKACLIEPVSVCLHGIDMAHIKVGDKVAISGGGGIGLIMLQLAKFSGAAKLTLIEPVTSKHALAKKLGARYAFDPVHQDVTAECMNVTDGLGYDVVIETSGSPRACQPAYDMLSRGGLLEFFALYPGVKYPLDLFDLWIREARICGVFQSPYMFPRAIEAFKLIDLDDFVDYVFAPEDCEKAFEEQMTGKPVKVIFKFA